MQYYFLGTLLPLQKYGEATEISLPDFKALICSNLTAKDLAKFEILLRFYDWVNLRAFWKKQPLGLIGNWDELEMETLLPEDVDLPPYFKAFLEQHPQKEERVSHFSELLFNYYQTSETKSFLGWWLHFEGGMRLHLAAIRAIAQNRSLNNEWLFKNPDFEEAYAIRSEVESKDYHPSDPYQNLMEVYMQHKDNPLELDQALDRFRYNAVEERLAFDHFSIDYILAYTVLFFMNLKFNLREEKSAKTLVEHYLKEVFK